MKKEFDADLFNQPVYLFGSNGFARKLQEHVNIAGIIDEYSDSNIIEGLPRFYLREVPRDTHIINCVIYARSYDAHRHLMDSGYDNISFIGDWITKYNEQFKDHFFAKAREAMLKDAGYLMSHAHQFEDDLSKKQFFDVLAFRSSLSIVHLKHFKNRIDEQYYEPFITNKNFQVLVDAGAYDGSDSIKFSEIFPGYKKIVALEPCTENHKVVAHSLHKLKNTQALNCALGESKSTMSFSGYGQSAKLTTDGNNKVSVLTLDDLLENEEEKTSILVKMDIEGSEMSALRGGSQLLKNPNASFAISAYHLPHDLKDIFNIFLYCGVKRRFYFRHYSTGFCESIIFAV